MRVLQSFLHGVRIACAAFPNKRRSDGVTYSMADIGLSAFSLFFMQSESFLSYQRGLQEDRKTSNCRTLFACHPVAEAIRTAGGDVLLTAKPSSHKALYDFMPGAVIKERTVKEKTGGKRLACRYRWFERAPLRDGPNAMLVNWVWRHHHGCQGQGHL